MEDTTKKQGAEFEAEQREIETLSDSTRLLTAAFKHYQDMVINLEAGIRKLKGQAEADTLIENTRALPLDQVKTEIENLVTQSVFTHLEADDRTI